EAPDLILLDVMMPGLDGYQVCERLKGDPDLAHIPMVMVTALSDVVERVRGLEAGADDFLSKPVRDVPLFARVRSLIRLKLMMDVWRVREQPSNRLGLVVPAPPYSKEDPTHGRILVVEDSEPDAASLRDALERDQHEIIVVATPEEANQQLRDGV